MTKNKFGGKSHRKSKKQKETYHRELEFKVHGQEYAQVVKLLGNGRLRAKCFDNKERLCIIRGKMKKRIWISDGDFILISLRDFQDEKADVIHKYTIAEARQLKALGEIPMAANISNVELDDTNEEECAFDFDFNTI